VSVITKVFKQILGKPCWQVKQGLGSFLTFEFGEPRLHIQEPRKPSKRASEKLRKRWARRSIFIHGDWHLWVYACDWKIFLKNKEIANDTSARKIIKSALVELDGQALVSVTIKKNYVSVFKFDLGGRLELIPNHKDYKDTYELWLFYEPSDKVFMLRADGKYNHTLGDGLKEGNWRPLIISKSKVVVK
jgi:hypothetical protein